MENTHTQNNRFASSNTQADGSACNRVISCLLTQAHPSPFINCRKELE
ncbi:MAG: hypothetical protein PHV76_08240 [Bacteroidales bacterium]|nr:hypothetical protein [Bacteroidales bacterium]